MVFCSYGEIQEPNYPGEDCIDDARYRQELLEALQELNEEGGKYLFPRMNNVRVITE